MLEISSKYLEDEVRDNFYIPSIAKRAWAAELSILDEINRICKKYNIKYYADWGTLLGTIRHQGFIPWDDDIDICMHRNELNKFLAVADNELPEGFKVICFENNDYSWKFIYNVVNTERMCFTPEYLKTHYNFPYMATIDIFVIDNVYDDEEKEEERKELVKQILSVSDVITEENINSNSIRELIKSIECKTGDPLDYSGGFIEIKRQLYSMVQKILAAANDTETEYIIQQVPWGIYHDMKYPREYYKDIIEVPYENTTIFVPLRYDLLLRKKYGNYWEVHMAGGGHGYPYYNSQKEALGLGENEDYILQYSFSKNLLSYDDSGKQYVDGLDKRRQLITFVDDLKNSEDYNGEFDRETVIFFPFNGEYWDKMLPFYNDEISKKDTDVFVIPIPYYYKKYNGLLEQEAQFNLELYPEELPVYMYDEIDLDAIFADRIYIQNPYDEYNMCMSVPPRFYASNLRNITRKLIYIPWFDTMDFQKENYQCYYNMRYYCTLPGVILADEVILDSNIIKDVYIEKLCEFAGIELKEIWEQKLLVKIRDKVCQNTIEKKKLLYYTSPSTALEYGDKYIDKLKECINVFEENRELIDIIWYLDNNSLSIIKNCDEKLYNKIVDIQEVFISMGFTIVREGTINTKLTEKCDAYYGDPSHFVKDFLVQKKPAMISNTDIISC